MTTCGEPVLTFIARTSQIRGCSWARPPGRIAICRGQWRRGWLRRDQRQGIGGQPRVIKVKLPSAVLVLNTPTYQTSA